MSHVGADRATVCRVTARRRWLPSCCQIFLTQCYAATPAAWKGCRCAFLGEPRSQLPNPTLTSVGPQVRDQEVGGSNPLAPTKFLLKISYLKIPIIGPNGSTNSVALFLPFSCNAGGCRGTLASATPRWVPVSNYAPDFSYRANPDCDNRSAGWGASCGVQVLAVPIGMP